MKQLLSILALVCTCSGYAQDATTFKVGVYGRAEAVPKNDGFLNVLLPRGGEVSARATCGLSLTHSFSKRWQLRLEPGFAYARYAAFQPRRDYARGFDDRSTPVQGPLYDKNYVFSLQIPLTATYYLIERHLMVSSGLETSLAALNFRKAAYLNADGGIDKVQEKDWMPALYSLNLPLSIGYQFRLSHRLISVEPGVNLCISGPSAKQGNYNRYSLKLAYYF